MLMTLYVCMYVTAGNVCVCTVCMRLKLPNWLRALLSRPDSSSRSRANETLITKVRSCQGFYFEP